MPSSRPRRTSSHGDDRSRDSRREVRGSRRDSGGRRRRSPRSGSSVDLGSPYLRRARSHLPPRSRSWSRCTHHRSPRGRRGSSRRLVTPPRAARPSPLRPEVRATGNSYQGELFAEGDNDYWEGMDAEVGQHVLRCGSLDLSCHQRWLELEAPVEEGGIAAEVLPRSVALVGGSPRS